MYDDLDLDEIRRMVEQYDDVSIMRSVIVLLLEREDRLAKELEHLKSKHKKLQTTYRNKEVSYTSSNYERRAMRRVLEKLFDIKYGTFNERKVEEAIMRKVNGNVQ